MSSTLFAQVLEISNTRNEYILDTVYPDLLRC